MRTVLSTLIACASATSIATAQQWPPSDSAIRGWIKSRVDSKMSAGIVVGLLDRGRTRVVSYAAPGSARSASLDRESVVEIGSITKTFTTTLLADMVVRGEVRLDDPVARYLPQTVRVPSRGGREITLLDLATQSSGLPRLPTNLAPKDPSNPYADYTVERLYAFLSSFELPRDIGTQYEYSNLGMGLLGHALALRAGQTYEALIRQRILEPLGMSNTAITLTPAMRSRVATGHDAAGRPAELWDGGALLAAGAIRSTMDDMLRYLAANMDTTSGPLAKAFALAHRPVRDVAPGLSIALAWHVLQSPNGPVEWHNGGTGGFHSFIGFQPATGANVVVLSNSSTDIDDIALHVIDDASPLKSLPSDRRAVSVPAATLDAYVGRYEISPTFALDITKDRNGLSIQATGQQKARLYAESDSAFFLRDFDAQLTFTRDSSGAVNGLVLHQGGADTPARKVR